MTQPQVLDTNIAQNVIELIGNTPLLQLNRTLLFSAKGRTFPTRTRWVQAVFCSLPD